MIPGNQPDADARGIVDDASGVDDDRRPAFHQAVQDRYRNRTEERRRDKAGESLEQIALVWPEHRLITDGGKDQPTDELAEELDAARRNHEIVHLSRPGHHSRPFRLEGGSMLDLAVSQSRKMAPMRACTSGAFLIVLGLGRQLGVRVHPRLHN